MKKTLVTLFVCLLTLAQAEAHEVSASSVDGSLNLSCGRGGNSDCRSDMVMLSMTSIISPTILTADISDSISGGTRKLLLEAREDAQVYVATEGEIFGVRLAAAAEALRKELPQGYTASEMHIAQAIIGM
jgi:Protein of unknown function (DUF2388).